MTFCLVVPDLHPEFDEGAGWKGQAPHLPALRSLLAGSIHRQVDSGWRAGLLQDHGGTATASLAPAAVAAWALQPATSGPAVAFAQPVHQVAGLSRVHLHPAGVLSLDAAEVGQLCRTFNRELGEGGPQLRQVGTGLLIAGGLGVANETSEAQDPVRWLGRELGPAGERISPALRRLGAEAEMWLHLHPMNRAREARGELPVNALWFWGGGAVSSGVLTGSSVEPPGIAYGDDPFLLGLWKALEGEVRPGVAAFGHMRDAPACAVTRTESKGDVEMLRRLEKDWFEPLLEALESRRIPALRLRLGKLRWDIRRRGFSRWWRRPAQWWEHFAS